MSLFDHLPHRFALGLAVIAVFAVAAPARAQGADPGYTIGPPEAWVSPLLRPTAYTVPQHDVVDGIYFLLTDSQINAQDPGVRRYVHNAYKVINYAGIESQSSFSLEFDPSYESVTLHTMRIIRSGTVLNQLRPERIKLYDRERDLERLQYNGRKTLHMLFEDVRKGDIIEYSYTVAGTNPALKNKFYSGFTMGWQAPVEKLYRRLLWPADRPLGIRNYGIRLDPKVTHRIGYIEYEWNLLHTRPVQPDDNTPVWHESFPWIQFSEAMTWAEVAKYEYDIFGRTPPLPDRVQAVADRIMARYDKKTDRMVAALRFVQDEIRYIAIFKGIGALVPNDLDTIMNRRYGDCKDKTVLLLALLRAMDITAYPVLANITKKQGIRNYLPSQTVFDHVFVRAEVGGAPYWIDGTMTHQGGDALHMVQPDYGPVLVLKPGTSKLTEMNPWRSRLPGVHTVTTFMLEGGAGTSGTMKVRTLFRGKSANHLRASLATRERTRMQQDYLEYYGNDYPGITVQALFTVDDDYKNNEIAVTEIYHMPDPWTYDDANKRWNANFTNSDLQGYLAKPKDTYRTSPLALPFPRHRKYETKIILPRGEWHFDDQAKSYANPYFVLDYDQRFSHGVLTYTFTYRTLTDHVPPDQIAAYQKALDEVNKITGSYSVFYDADSPPPDTPRNTECQGGGCDVRVEDFPDFSAGAGSNRRSGTAAAVLGLGVIVIVLALVGLLASWLVRRRAETKHHALAMVELPEFCHRHDIAAPAAQVWSLLTAHYPALSGQRVTLIDTDTAVGSLAERNWSATGLMAGQRLREQGRRRFGLTGYMAFSEIAELVPGKKLVLRTPMQSAFRSWRHRRFQVEGTLTLDLKDEGDWTNVTLTLANRYRYPSYRKLRAARARRRYGRFAAAFARRLRRAAHRHPVPLLQPSMAD